MGRDSGGGWAVSGLGALGVHVTCLLVSDIWINVSYLEFSRTAWGMSLQLGEASGSPHANLQTPGRLPLQAL